MAPTTQELATIDQLTEAERQITELEENLPNFLTPVVVNIFGKLKPLEKKLDSLNKAARAELIERREEGGEDDRGHRYFATDEAGVKLERRVSIKIEDDAVERLEAAGVQKFPRKFDEAKARELLEKAGIDEIHYTDPVVDKKFLESLLENAQVLGNQELEDAILSCIKEESITWAAKPVEPQKAQLEG